MAAAETQLTLAFDRTTLNRFRRSTKLRELSARAPVRQKVQATYFDTTDLRLFEKGISLRIRRAGRKWLQTVQAESSTDGHLAKPLEHKVQVSSKRPDINKISDPTLHDRVLGAIAEQPLQPVIQTAIWRTSREIDVGNEGTVALAIDHGEVSAGGRKAELFEVGLALKSGSPHAVLSAAEQLFGGQRIELSPCSPSERGYRLIAGGADGNGNDAALAHCRRPMLKAGMSPADALAEIGRSTSEQILHNWRLSLRSDDPEGPHQLRVGLRRLRTAIRTFRAVTADTDLTRIGDTARDLGRMVGRLRDADVLIGDIYFPAASQLAHDSNQGMFLDVLMQNRERQRAAVRASLDQPRWTWLKLNCVLIDAAIERATFGQSERATGKDVGWVARKALRKAWKRARDWGQRLDQLTIAERHEMRKTLKSLRYAVEFFLPLYASKNGKQFLKQLKRLQDVFGYLNDVALAERLPKLVAVTHSDKPELQRSAALLCEWHNERAAHAWSDAKNRWNAVADAPKFWR